jgi:hypothetical protein
LTFVPLQTQNHYIIIPGREYKGNINTDNNKYCQRTRHRNEAFLIKVDNEQQWMQAYRELMRAREAVNVTTGKTKDGSILIELKAGTSAIDIVEKIKTLTTSMVIQKPLQNMVLIEIKNIDPLIDIEELKNDVTRDLKISNVNCVELKSLKSIPWGTQQAIAVIPVFMFLADNRNMKIRTGLTVASVKILPRILRCQRCHKIGHNTNRCKEVSFGKELYRKCGDGDHIRANCNRVVLCVKRKT